MKKRVYTQDTVRSLQGSVKIDHTLAKHGARNLRRLLEENDYILHRVAKIDVEFVHKSFIDKI